MGNLKNKFKSQNLHFLSLAFEKARINLGSTKSNPSVGCVVEKDGAVISSACTSINGRPHAEFNALNKNIDFKNSSVYVTLEPCSHYGMTPPCTNLIIKKKVKRVFYSFTDIDKRSKNKSKNILKKENILIKGSLLKSYGQNFYKSYYLKDRNELPLTDAKIAVSRDYFTKNKKNKHITNHYSRNRSHLIRSMYDCIISTSKSINDDNSMLNCRIDGLENKSPDLAIIDRKLKIKKNLRIFKKIKNRKVLLFTCSNNIKKISYLKKRGLIIFSLSSLKTKDDFKKLLFILKNRGYSRIFVETGLTLLNFLIKNKLLNNIYLFKTKNSLKKLGINYSKTKLIKKINLKNLINVYLYGDKLYKEKLK